MPSQRRSIRVVSATPNRRVPHDCDGDSDNAGLLPVSLDQSGSAVGALDAYSRTAKQLAVR